MLKSLKIKEKKNLRYKEVCGERHVHVNEAKAEIQAGPNCPESQENQGMGKGCVKPKEGTFFFNLHNQTLQNMWV